MKSTKSSEVPTKKTKAKQSRPVGIVNESLTTESDILWDAAPRTNFQSVALTVLMRQELENLELDEETGEPRTVGQGFVKDVIKSARRGGAAAMSLVFDRMEGKVPTTAINVNATFTDEERVARVLGLIKRGADQAGAVATLPAGESGT